MDVLDLEISVIRADGLAAKDTNFLGFPTKSDPYCEVVFHPKGIDSQYEEDHIAWGKTVICMKTLKPEWNQSFQRLVPMDGLKDDAQFQLILMDYDKLSEDDLMGRVDVFLPLKEIKRLHYDFEQTKWYAVPKCSADGEEAKGRVQVTLKTKLKSVTQKEYEAAKK
jgi:Ca2+-dependent lipid-binding protein